MTIDHLFFVMAAYVFTALVLIVLCAASYWRWRQLRAEYRRLFERTGQGDA